MTGDREGTTRQDIDRSKYPYILNGKLMPPKLLMYRNSTAVELDTPQQVAEYLESLPRGEREFVMVQGNWPLTGATNGLDWLIAYQSMFPFLLAVPVVPPLADRIIAALESEITDLKGELSQTLVAKQGTSGDERQTLSEYCDALRSEQKGLRQAIAIVRALASGSPVDAGASGSLRPR